MDLSQVTLISVIGTTDRLDGQVGRLVAVDDIEAMAQNILELLSDGSVRQHFGEKARERARDFSVHRNVSAYGPLLTRLLEESP